MLKFLSILAVLSVVIVLGMGFFPVGHSATIIYYAGSSTSYCSYNICNYDSHKGIAGSIMVSDYELLSPQVDYADHGRPQDLVVKPGDDLSWWVGLGKDTAPAAWLQAGYCLGTCPDNVFHAVPMMYLESITLAGSYTFTNLGDAPIWSTHTFQVWFTSGVGHVTVDGGADHTVATDLTSGMLEARMEMHQATTLGFTGYFRNLQYYDGATWWAWGQPNTNCFFNCNYFQQVNYAPYCVYGGSATWFATDGLCYLRQGGGTFAKKVMPLWDARLSFDTNPPPPQPPSYVDLTLYFVIGTVAVFAVGFVLLNKFVLSARKRK